MKIRLIALAFCPMVAGQAHAADLQAAPLALVESKAANSPRFDFRLVADGDIDRLTQAPVRRSGMIASTEVAPNATLGFGLVRSGTRRTSETQPGLRSTGSRKAAVSFQLKF